MTHRNDTNHSSDVNVGDSGNSFEKHGRKMKAFRRSHVCLVKTAPQTGNSLTEYNRRTTMSGSTHLITEAVAFKNQKYHVWEMTRPWQISDMTDENGGISLW